MSKIFLHLGAHKTATTFLQQNLVASKNALGEQNWRGIWLQKERPEIYHNIRWLRDGKEKENPRKVVLKYFQELRDEPRNIFLSTETALGTMDVRNSKGVIYPHTATMANLLKNEFADREITVGFCIRDFADFVESGYSFLIMKGGTSSFENYYGAVVPENLSWISVIATLSAAFGPQRLRLWTYEDFCKDPTASFLTIMKAATIEPENLSVPVTNPRNVSISPGATRVALAWNKFMKKIDHMPKAEHEKLNNEMTRLLSKVREPAPAKRLLTPEQRAELNARYEAELSVIRERWHDSMLPLPVSPKVSEKAESSHQPSVV